MGLPRGMRDLDDADLRAMETVREQFLRLADLHGYRRLDPSPIESIKTLEEKSGPSIRDEIYAFEDKGGREVGLRFDFTVGVTRHAASSRSLALPAKFASFGGVFRYDEPQRGRYRHFSQWNVEIYGPPGPATDAELAEFSFEMLRGLGLHDASIRLSHRTLVEELVGRVMGSCPPEVLRALDRMQKRPRKDLVSELASAGHDSSKAEKVLNLANIRGTAKEVESRVDVADLESWKYLRTVLEMLSERGVRAEADLGIVRGLDYYSGVVFEAFAGGQDALAGGGRYDSLAAALGRPDLGAAGAAGGVERTVLAMQDQGLVKNAGPSGTWVVYADGLQREATSLASELRKRGVRTVVDLAGRSFKKQFEAARASAKHAIILRPDSTSVKNLESREQQDVDKTELISDPARFLP